MIKALVKPHRCWLFSDERAEIRLIIDDKIGEFGIGKTHLNDCLKSLALIDPTIIETEINEFSAETLEKIFTERENSYTFFVTAVDENNLPDEIRQRAKILKY